MEDIHLPFEGAPATVKFGPPPFFLTIFSVLAIRLVSKTSEQVLATRDFDLSTSLNHGKCHGRKGTYRKVKIR